MNACMVGKLCFVSCINQYMSLVKSKLGNENSFFFFKSINNTVIPLTYPAAEHNACKLSNWKDLNHGTRMIFYDDDCKCVK